jgi:hypothetical protein
MDNKEQFIQHLNQKGKKKEYVEKSKDLLKNIQPTAITIDKLVRNRWNGYVSRDKETYQILNDYADFCEKSHPDFTAAFHEHISKTFEGEAHKAIKAYKKALVPIPVDTRINPNLLNGLTNAAFVEAYNSLHNFIHSVYDAIEKGSPFEWGWPDWRGITADGLNHNLVMEALNTLANKTKPTAKLKQTIKKLDEMGLKNLLNDPNLNTVFNAYFKQQKSEHRIFSHRFVEDPATQPRETFFLAKTDGEPEERREIYYWLYDEAVKNGCTPTGNEEMGCYLYRKDKKTWLLLGSGHSYHEDAFLHSPPYAMAAKAKFHRVFYTHPEKMDYLIKRFPESFGRPWAWCFHGKVNSGGCKNNVTVKINDRDYNHCGLHHYLYFHDPTFEDVKAIMELFKLEANPLGKN